MLHPLESPVPWIFFGIVAALVGGIVFVNTRRVNALATTALLVLAITGGGLLLEHWVVTEYEAIEQMLDDLATDIEANDLEAVLEHVSQEATKTRGLARVNMGLVEIEHAKATDLEVEINELTSPPTAKTKFTAVVRGKLKSSSAVSEQPFLERVKFTAILEKGENGWVITDELDFNPKATGATAF
jgi:hypothetical protein